MYLRVSLRVFPSQSRSLRGTTIHVTVRKPCNVVHFHLIQNPNPRLTYRFINYGKRSIEFFFFVAKACEAAVLYCKLLQAVGFVSKVWSSTVRCLDWDWPWLDCSSGWVSVSFSLFYPFGIFYSTNRDPLCFKSVYFWHIYENNHRS